MRRLSSIGPRLFPIERLSNYVMQRVRARRGLTRLPYVLEYRNVFILPTAFGVGFGLMLVFMALGGLNFNNNMALLLVFLLATIAQLTTLLTYRNLAALQVEEIHAEPVFCGEPAAFHVYLRNPEERVRFTIQAANPRVADCRDLEGLAGDALTVHQATAHRGWQPLAPFRLETRFPLGLFRAWAWLFPTARCLVYPAPDPNPPPLPTAGEGHGGQTRRQEGEQIFGLRAYRLGDPLRRVAWRASARHEQLLTREMEHPHRDACELSWGRLEGRSVEQRIAVLAAWVLRAEQRRLAYSLDLPGVHVPLGTGDNQRARCLRHLALYGL